MEYFVSEKSGAAIQNEINRAAANGGGRVVVPPGIYPSGTIWLKSNIDLHLAAGAVIKGIPNADEYDEFRHPGIDAVTPEKSRKALLACCECENVSVTGSGEINGTGPDFFDRNIPDNQVFEKPNLQRPRMVQFFKCRNIFFEGVSFVDSPNWTFWLADCEDVHITRIRITGSFQLPNNDGIDIDSCRRVTVSDSFFQTSDDCLILRAIRKDDSTPAICEQVTVTNCVLNSRCQGIRLGCPSDDTIRNCSFSHIIFRGTGSGIHSEHPFRYLRKNCTGYMLISDIAFDNFDITTDRYPIRLGCENGIQLRGLQRFSFSNFRINSKLPISLEGSSRTVLKDISFRDISGTVDGPTPIAAHCVENLQLDRFRLSAVKTEDAPFQRIPGDSWETQF